MLEKESKKKKNVTHKIQLFDIYIYIYIYISGGAVIGVNVLR